MGACQNKPPAKTQKPSAEQQAKTKEATANITTNIEADVKKAEKEVQDLIKAEEEAKKREEEEAKKKKEEEDKKKKDDDEKKKQEEEEKEKEPSETSSQAREKRREAEAKLKKAKKRLNKLDSLRKARDIGALTLDDYNAAVRRLQSSTGNDPTNPEARHALPEGFEWFTSTLEVMWPSIREYTKQMVKDTIQPSINRACAPYGVSCSIKKLDLGRNFPAFGPIQARYVDGTSGGPQGPKAGVEISLGITIRSDMKLEMSTSAGSVGVQNFSFTGTLYFWLRPFLDAPPFIGNIEMAFVNPPTLELDWTGFVGGSLEMFGLQKMVRDTIDHYMGEYMVVPNFFTYQMTQDPRVDAAHLRCPKPEGVLRLTIGSVKNIPSNVGSNVHVSVKVGAQKWATPPASNRKVPIWREAEATRDFLIFNQDQWVVIELRDSQGDDDVIGKVLNVPANRLVKRHHASIPLTKQNFPVTNDQAQPTMINVKAQWVSIDSSNPAEGDCLASVQIVELRGIPSELAERAPFRIAGTAGQDTRKTKPGVYKPGSITDATEMLKNIREHVGKDPKQVAGMFGLVREGDIDLVEDALEMDGTNFKLSKTEDGNEWWMGQHYLLDWQAFKGDKSAKWAASEEGNTNANITNKEFKRRTAYFESYDKLDKWHNLITTTQRAARAALDPYYCQVLHLWAPEAKEVTLKLLDKEDKEVASAVIPVQDSALGDEADVLGPFTLKFENGETCEVSGDITVRDLAVSDSLPSNWNVTADALVAKDEFVEWWKHEEIVMDWLEWKNAKEDPDAKDRVMGLVPFGNKGQMWMARNWKEGDKVRADEEELKRRDEFYTTGNEDNVAGSGLTDSKEEALMDCLKAGSLTWGDYDVVLAKLRGEKDAPVVAETLEWLNMIVSAMWPGINRYTVKLMKESIEPMINATAKSYLSALSVKFTKVNLGKREPAFGTIQCRKLRPKGVTGETLQNEGYEGVELIFNDIAFISQIDVQVAVTLGKTITLGVKDMLFKGSVLVTLKPMLPGLPIVGAIQVVLPNPPEFDIKLTGSAGELLEGLKGKVPALDTMSKDVIVGAISSACAIPNYYVYPLLGSLDVTELRYPKPIGILRLEFKEAMHLRAGDTDNSDSYVVAKVGCTVQKTKPVTSLNPKWTNEQDNVMDFVVYNLDQNVDIEVFDADFIAVDDSLGAVFQKGTVLGGGIDEIKRGIPVRAVKQLGTAVLPLQEKVKDVVCTGKNTIDVYELRNVVGYDQTESVVVFQASWMSADQEGDINKAFITSVCVHEGKNLNVGLGGPYTVRATVGGKTMATRTGTAPQGRVMSSSELALTIERMRKQGLAEEKIAKSLHLTKKLVKAASELKPNSLKEEEQKKMSSWHSDCVKATNLFLQGTNPQYNQVMHIAFPATRETEIKGDAVVYPVTLELVNKKGTVLGSAVRDIAIAKPFKGDVILSGVDSAPGATITCELSLTGLKAKAFDPKAMSEEEEILGLTPFEGPEFIDTEFGVQPKIGMYVCCRNLVKAKELNWRVATKKEGERVKRGDRPQPEGKVIGWTQDNQRAIVDFGSAHGEWRVKPGNLCNAPPPLPPPPPPQKLYVVADEMMEVEGEFDVLPKQCRGIAFWEREAYGEGEVWRIFADEQGHWAIGPAHMEGVAYVRSAQQHHGRFPHMMGHEIEATTAQSTVEPPPKILWQRMDISLEDDDEILWVDDATIEVTITKPIAREHEEVLEEMADQVMDDIMDDLLADLEENLDLEAELQADLENDLAAEVAEMEDETMDQEDDGAAAAAAAEEEERQRQAEEEEQRRQEEEQRRQEEEEKRREEEERKREEEEERRRQKEEEAAKRKEEEERKKEEAEKKKKEEEERKKKEAEEKKKKEEEEKKRKAEEEKRKKEEEERRKREEAERKKREEAERKRQEELRKKKAEAERKKREAERKARKAAKRKGKMETLQKALELGAMTKMDHITALRRLQSVTGEDPTNGERGYTLPETMQWFTTSMEVLWPHLRVLLSDKMRDICAPALEAVSSKVSIVKVDLGNHSPAFGPISAKYIDGVDGSPKATVEIGLGLTYQASVDIKFKVGQEETTVQRLKCVGTMYFWLRPFTNQPPFIGGMQAAFVNPPTVKFMFLTAQSLQLRRAQQIVQKAVEKAVAINCVVPNFITIPFGETSTSHFAAPAPQGVLKVTIVKAQDLEAADEGFNPTSDPYVTVSVGADQWRTPTIKETLTPEWKSGNSQNFMVYNPDQWIMIDVYDEDEGKTDDHIGGVVGLPINRLVLRCMDKDNKTGTVDIPLQRNNQPVQGETGEVSTVTVKAEWLSIDNQTETKGESLVAVTIKDIEGIPTAFEGPFRIRAVVETTGDAEHSKVKESRPSFILEKGISPKSLFKQIVKLLKEEKTANDIADTLSIPVPIAKQAVQIIEENSAGQTMVSIRSIDVESIGSLAAWLEEAKSVLEDRDRNEHPYFLDVIYIHTQSSNDQVKLEVLDSNDEVMGQCNIEVKDDKLGDEPDVVGPFIVNLPAARGKAKINGHIVVSSLVDKGIPNSWNPKSKRHKAMGDERKKRPNEDIIKANAGGKLTSEKEEALSECLKSGALTWGDYDILIGKLRGESERTSIAETLEWVNMIVNKVWPKLRTFLEKKILTSVQDQLKQAAASLSSSSWVGLQVDVKSASLGAKEPSFTTINADKVMKHGKQGLVISFNNITFNSNICVEMEVAILGVVSKVDIKDLKFQSTLVVELHDLHDQIPFIGSIEAYFPNPPHIDITLDIARTGEIPGMRSLSVGALNQVIADVMVLPNTLYTNLLSSSTVVQREVKKPAGVLRLAVQRARHLMAGDEASMLSSQKSDAYAYCRVGATIKQTKTIVSFDPEWLETFDFVVQDMSQWVDIEVFDDDIKADDTLGALWQKETVLGGGTEIISRGIPVRALCRKVWNADDRNKEYVCLPLAMKEVDKELSVENDPYLGARVKYTGGGKYKGSVEFEDGSVLDEGDEGVVEEIDNSTKPFATFHCAFKHCTAALHAMDFKVTRPLIVEKMTPVVGVDKEESVLHVHPEWLTTTGPGKTAAQLLTITLDAIEQMPELAERDLGVPFYVRFTAEDPESPAELWPAVVSKAGEPEAPSDTSLNSFIRTLTNMGQKKAGDQEIAAVLEITEELVKEGIELFVNSMKAPGNSVDPNVAEQKMVTVKPKKKRGKEITFPLVAGEDVKETRFRMRNALSLAPGSMLTLTVQDKGDAKIEPRFDDIEEGATILYVVGIAPATYNWLSRCHAHINKVRSATHPTYGQTMHLVSPSHVVPCVRLEILSSAKKPLGSLKLSTEEVGDKVSYPQGPYEVVIEKEASGGGMFWGSKTEAYKYTPKVCCNITVEPLNMRS